MPSMPCPSASVAASLSNCRSRQATSAIWMGLPGSPSAVANHVGQAAAIGRQDRDVPSSNETSAKTLAAASSRRHARGVEIAEELHTVAQAESGNALADRAGRVRLAIGTDDSQFADNSIASSPRERFHERQGILAPPNNAGAKHSPVSLVAGPVEKLCGDPVLDVVDDFGRDPCRRSRT
jgi:hypothetical protein